jgi:nucleoside-diphosphate-sugar epimerase
MKIVILGYSGFIGQSILENLIKNTSHDLVCVGRSIKKKPFQGARIKYFEWDFTSFNKLNFLFLRKTDVIVNCVGKTCNNFNSLENINVIFLKKLLKYLSSNKFKLRLIHLSSVSVYGGAEIYFNQTKIIKENTKTKVHNFYSQSKLKGDKLIKSLHKKNSNKNLSYTILRISNVFEKKKKSNLYSFILFCLKFGFWIKSSNEVMYNFVNVKDVSQAIKLIISNLKVSKNKTYIVSDDCRQYDLYKIYNKFYDKKFLIISIPINLIKFLINFFPIPKKLLNFFLLISTKVSYSNERITKELKFNPKFSLIKKIKDLNE